MNKNRFFSNLKYNIEKYLPMSIGGFFLFIIVIYMIFSVTKTVWSNYLQNKEIENEQQKITELADEVELLQYQISYYKTNSFREKQARAKLGYKAPGENVISLPLDTEVDKIADEATPAPEIKTPNYRLWIDYFFHS